MIEVRYLNAVTAGIGYAGDTYNTAVYLRRTADVLGTDVEVGYLTGLGDDEDSAAMRTAWAAEGIVDRSVVLDGLLPGLYTVRVDDRGERRFSYWRSSSAARHLFTATEWVEHLEGDVIHLSGITLQLASPAAREALRHRLAELRAAGTLISLDTNYRASGWSRPWRSRPRHGRGGEGRQRGLRDLRRRGGHARVPLRLRSRGPTRRAGRPGGRGEVGRRRCARHRRRADRGHRRPRRWSAQSTPPQPETRSPGATSPHDSPASHRRRRPGRRRMSRQPWCPIRVRSFRAQLG